MICCLNMKGAYVGSHSVCVFFISVFVHLTEMNSQSDSMMESAELKERRATIIDNHHRSNKSKRFIANGGFEYLYDHFVRSYSFYVSILIYLSHLINVRQEVYVKRLESPAVSY